MTKPVNKMSYEELASHLRTLCSCQSDCAMCAAAEAIETMSGQMDLAHQYTGEAQAETDKLRTAISRALRVSEPTLNEHSGIKLSEVRVILRGTMDAAQNAVRVARQATETHE